MIKQEKWLQKESAHSKWYNQPFNDDRKKEVMHMATTLHDIRTSFDNSPFISHLGFEIVTFEEENVVLKLSIKENLYNINHTLHGGVHASILDTVQGMLIRSISKTRVNTLQLNINYLAPAASGEIYAKAKILQIGYKIVTAEGTLEDSNRNMLAKATGMFKLIRD
jgi:uncharacterized protein (TIGR00369 family)